MIFYDKNNNFVLRYTIDYYVLLSLKSFRDINIIIILVSSNINSIS